MKIHHGIAGILIVALAVIIWTNYATLTRTGITMNLVAAGCIGWLASDVGKNLRSAESALQALLRYRKLINGLLLLTSSIGVLVVACMVKFEDHIANIPAYLKSALLGSCVPFMLVMWMLECGMRQCKRVVVNS